MLYTKPPSLYASKIIVKVKVDNKETNRLDKSNMPPLIWSWGMNILKWANNAHLAYFKWMSFLLKYLIIKYDI